MGELLAEQIANVRPFLLTTRKPQGSDNMLIPEPGTIFRNP